MIEPSLLFLLILHAELHGIQDLFYRLYLVSAEDRSGKLIFAASRSRA